MKKFLLLIATAWAALAGGAQTTYNFFDAADVDADGWLWFDTQAKIDKYVGFGSNFKIQLQPCGYEDADFQYPEPWADPEIPGYNVAGEEGGEGAKFGAIVLNASSVASGFGSDNPDGGGFMLWLPDCAQFDVFLSTGYDVIVVGLKAGMGDWVKAVDCALVKTWMKMGSWIKPLANAYQYQFDNIQSYANANAPYTTIASEKGKKVTALFTNNGKELYVHGMRVLTYTETEAGVKAVSMTEAASIKLENDQLNAGQGARIVVYDTMGRVVMQGNESVDLSRAAHGMYVAKAVTANGISTIKVAR